MRYERSGNIIGNVADFIAFFVSWREEYNGYFMQKNSVKSMDFSAYMHNYTHSIR